MDEFGRRGFGLVMAHRLAIFGGLIVGILSLGFSVLMIACQVLVLCSLRGGMGGIQMQTSEVVLPLFVAALAFGLTAFASRPARPADPAETRELRRAMVLLGELESKLGSR
jgi:hypothetical protein